MTGDLYPVTYDISDWSKQIVRPVQIKWVKTRFCLLLGGLSKTRWPFSVCHRVLPVLPGIFDANPFVPSLSSSLPDSSDNNLSFYIMQSFIQSLNRYLLCARDFWVNETKSLLHKSSSSE